MPDGIAIETLMQSGLGRGFGTGSSAKGKSPDLFYDGNYTNGFPVSAPVPTYPFLDQGDTQTVIYKQEWEQSVTSYKPLDLTQPNLKLGGAYPLGDVNFRDGKAGVVIFERRFCNLPKTRTRRGQSFAYPFQFITKSGVHLSTEEGGEGFSFEGPTYALGTLVMTVDSYLIYDYFLNGQENTQPLKHAPRYIPVGQNIRPVGQDMLNGNFPLYLVGGCVCANRVILAEDDVYADWQGAIKCRVRRVIDGPTPQFWNANS